MGEALMKEKWNLFLEKIKEQEFFQQLQSSYQQLSLEQQNYVKWGSTGAAFLIVFFYSWGVYSDSNSSKSEYFEKQELLQTVNKAGDEIRRLKGQNIGLSQTSQQNWKSVMQNLVSGQGLTADKVEVAKETPGTAQSIIQETLLDVNLKEVPLKPLTQVLYQIEHGTPPMKLKSISIENSATEGLLNAKLMISGFMPKPEKK